MIYQDFLDTQELQRYASAMNTRAKRCNAKGILSAEPLRDRIFESGGQCEWCATNLVNQAFELDHVLSLSQQGLNTPDNLVVSCERCNRRKSSKHPARFASEIYNETGHKTSLVSTILNQYNMTPTTQLSLFDKDPNESSIEIEPDENRPSVPPYDWS